MTLYPRIQTTSTMWACSGSLS